MAWVVEYFLPTEGGDRGGQRERELPKGGLTPIEPQKTFLQRESNGGLALRRDLRNRGFDVDDVGDKMVYRGAITSDGKQILWVPYSRWWSYTHPVGYQTYYVPLTLVNEPTPEERAALRRAAELAAKEAAEAERVRREREAQEAKDRREREAQEEKERREREAEEKKDLRERERIAEAERREREAKIREEQQQLELETRRQALEDQKKRIEEARAQAELARAQAEIDRARREAEALAAPPTPPAAGPFKTLEIFGVMAGQKVPLPVALRARQAGDPSASLKVTESAQEGFGLAGDLAQWKRFVPSGDTLGHRADRGVLAWDGQRAVPVDASTLGGLFQPGWQSLVYG